MVNGVLFLDLKKAFDTVDHAILLTKLRYYGVETASINWFTSYLENRQQVCYANGITSSIDYVTRGVPQGSILGPLLFLIYINDISKCLDYGVARLFADDTNLTFSGCSFPALQNKMSKDLKGIASWLSANRLTLNVLKTDFMVVGSRQRVASLEEDIALSLLDTKLEQVKSVKCLGVDIDEYLTWDNHMLSIRQNVTRNVSVLRRVKPFLKTENLINIYRSIIEPYFTYCCIVWDSISETQTVNLQKLQNRAARIITGASYSQRSSDVLCELGWMTLETMDLSIIHLSMDLSIHPSIHVSIYPSIHQHHVQSFSFAGAKVEDMNDFVKPLLRRRPDKVIVHVGTNNVKDDNPKRVKVKISELVDTIRNEQPNAKIVLSSIIHRNDDRSLNGSIDQVNRAVESVCRHRGLDFISHDNIPGDCLNNGGLHLNRKGVFSLANNFRKYLSLHSN